MKKILMLEDEAPFANVLAEFLGFHDYDVDVVGTLPDAQDAAIQKDYDLIIADMFIRNGDQFDPRGGLGLINWIRSQRWNKGSALSDIPIIAMTGIGNQDFSRFTLSGAHTSGADKVFVKPMDAEDLLASIRALLKNKGLSAEPA